MKNNLITVFSGNEIEVVLLQGALEESGISSTTRYGTISGVDPLWGGAPVAMDLFINESDLEKARPIIEAFIQNRDLEK